MKKPSEKVNAEVKENPKENTVLAIQSSPDSEANGTGLILRRSRLRRTVYTIITLALAIVLYGMSQIVHIPEALMHFLTTIIAVLFVHLLDRWWLLKDTLEEFDQIKQYISSDTQSCVDAMDQSSLLHSETIIGEIKHDLMRLDHEMKSRLSTIESTAEQGMNTIKGINYTSAFLAPQIQMNDCEPHLVAYLNTGKTVTLQYLKSMAEKVKHLAEGSPIEISDVPVTGHFLTNIVNALDDLNLGQKIVWLGTSLAVNPLAWSISNRVLADYQLSLVNRIRNETMTVYRLFTIDSRLRDAESWKEKLKNEELKKQAGEGIKVKLLVMPAPPVDFSLICIPRRVPCEMLSPSDEWDDMLDKGYEVICGIEWMIRGYTYVEGARIWPQSTPWIKEKYKEFYRFWQAEEATEIYP